MTPQERYEDLVGEFDGVDGCTPPPGGSGFGRGALRYRRKIFAMFVRGQLVVKLAVRIHRRGGGLPPHAWDISRSSLDVGLLGLTFVPVLIIGLLGGLIADAVDRRKLALATSVGLMAVSAAFAVQAYAQFGRLWLLYLLALVQAVLQATSAPSRGTFVPRLVPPDRLTAALALNTLTGRITMLFGPALAGVIAGAFGLRTCYAIDAVSFLASLYATARLPAMRPQSAQSPAKPGAAKPGAAKPGAARRGTDSL
jgi:MFS family permease